MTDQVYVLKELWVDPMENNFHSAQGYSPIGFVTDEEDAYVLCEEAGNFIGNGWPFARGTAVPKMIFEPVPRHAYEPISGERKIPLSLKEQNERERLKKLGRRDAVRRAQLAAQQAARKK